MAARYLWAEEMVARNVGDRAVQRHSSNMNILQVAYSSGRPDLQLVFSGFLSGNVHTAMQGTVFVLVLGLWH